MKKLFVALAVVYSFTVSAQNQAPVISNFQVHTDPDAGDIKVRYDLTDAENDAVEISIFISIDSGKNYIYQPAVVTGDVGFPVMPGPSKLATVQFDTLNMNSNVFYKIVADDRQPVNIQAIVNQVDSNQLKNHLTFIQGARNHISNSAHLYVVRDSLFKYFSSLGLNTRAQMGFNNGYPLRNVIGSKTGTVNEKMIYIADAHYDGVPGSPAADDNGSGVAGLMEAARILSQYNFKNSIQFIGFDVEEYGLLGSDYYVRNLPATDTIAGVINLEMIGYYSDRVNSQELPAGFNLLFPAQTAAVAADSFRGNFIANIANTASDPLKKAFDSAAAKYVPALKVISLAVPGTGTIAPDLRRSDHASFWDNNIPALMITNTSEFRNKNYHTVNDVLDSLNFTFMRQVTMATVATLAELAEITNSTFATAPLEIGFGINSLQKQVFNVYPNPVKDKVTIELHNNVSDNYIIDILSVTGERIYSRHIKKGLKKFTVDVKNYPAGVYFITVITKNEKQTVKITLE